MADIIDVFSELKIDDKKPTKKTGLVYDDRMIEHRCLWYPDHIECPERYICALQRCKDYDLVRRCTLIPSRFADEDEILLLHNHEYVESVKKIKTCNNFNELEMMSSAYDAVYFHPKTYESALLATGCTLELVSSILNGKIKNGMALVRPPGHHAMVKEACGFCFFNNVAIATKHALSKYKLKRILIVDWDVHHGQATQQMFYDDPRVLYFSIHRYEHGAFWPELRESNFDFIGQGAGKGFNINVPLNKTKLGNAEYLAIFNNILLPVAYEFNPELVIISAGYDAALGCPEGEMEVTPHAYAHLLNLISGVADGRICAVLEGGYFLPSLAESVALTLRSLLGDPCPVISATEIIDESAVETILNVITALRPFWQSLCIQNNYESAELEKKPGDKKKHVTDIKYVGTLPLSKPQNYPTRDYCPVQEPSIRQSFEMKLEKLIGEVDLTVPEHRTCIIFDSRMTQHFNRKEKWHPEKAERVTEIYKKLGSSGLLEKCFLLESRKALDAELNLVHSEEYINKIKATATMKNRDIAKLQAEYQSIYMCHATYESAILACGSLLQAVDAVMNKKCVNGFALIRPPGHHAEIDEACGFCFFNSVSIAAKYALKNYGLKKVLILDWDVHHGNGIQHIFYKDSNVLYISLHRYDGGSFFPSETEASFEACGEGQGLGFNINIPWNAIVGDGDFLAAFFHIILPVAYEFCPDLVLVSAGFDAALDDPLGGCKVSPACYGHMTKLLSGLANGKIVLALEGGYNLTSTSDAVFHCVNALLGESCVPLPDGICPSDSAIETIQNVVQIHQKYWKCLNFGVDLPVFNDKKSQNGQINTESLCIADNTNPSIPVSIPTRAAESEEIKDGTIPDILLACAGAEANWTDDNTLFCVTPLEDCPHLELLQSLPPEGLNPFSVCQDCNDSRENWVCLHCYQVYCGRFINQHMMQHGYKMQHYLTLSYSDLSVWCYGCDSYIHNRVLMPAKQDAHIKKFGAPM